jgi:hypothetical protein
MFLFYAPFLSRFLFSCGRSTKLTYYNLLLRRTKKQSEIADQDLLPQPDLVLNTNPSRCPSLFCFAQTGTQLTNRNLLSFTSRSVKAMSSGFARSFSHPNSTLVFPSNFTFRASPDLFHSLDSVIIQSMQLEIMVNLSKAEEGASTRTATPGVHAPKQRKKRMQRESPQVPGACTLLSLIYISASVFV